MPQDRNGLMTRKSDKIPVSGTPLYSNQLNDVSMRADDHNHFMFSATLYECIMGYNLYDDFIDEIFFEKKKEILKPELQKLLNLRINLAKKRNPPHCCNLYLEILKKLIS